MKKIIHFWSVMILDLLGVTLMLAALLTGWLPGPGGIPLFILGLSLLAINHDWAKRYIDLLRKYADRLGDYVFVKDRRVQLLYDMAAPALIGGSVYLLIRQSAVWQISIGIFLLFLGLTIFLGNRNRWQRLKAIIKQKH